MTTTTRRPAPANPDAWEAHALCGDMDGDLWFPHSFTTSTGLLQTAQAIHICRNCPVQLECAEDALQREGSMKADSRNGIRGGLTPQERHGIYRARRQARSAA